MCMRICICMCICMRMCMCMIATRGLSDMNCGPLIPVHVHLHMHVHMASGAYHTMHMQMHTGLDSGGIGNESIARTGPQDPAQEVLRR